MASPDGDRAVLDAARTVLLRDPRATMAEVAREAGMGVGGIYRRYGGKQELFRKVCDDNLRRYIAIGEAALADSEDAWASFGRFLEQVVQDGIHQLTPCLAGVVTMDDGLRDLAAQAAEVVERILRAARATGLLRADVAAADVTLLIEQLGTVELGDAARTAEIRRRYLALLLDGLRADASTGRLPGPPPQEEELGVRWG